MHQAQPDWLGSVFRAHHRRFIKCKLSLWKLWKLCCPFVRWASSLSGETRGSGWWRLDIHWLLRNKCFIKFFMFVYTWKSCEVLVCLVWGAVQWLCSHHVSVSFRLCFKDFFVHKFKAVLGKNRIIFPGEKVSHSWLNTTKFTLLHFIVWVCLWPRIISRSWKCLWQLPNCVCLLFPRSCWLCPEVLLPVRCSDKFKRSVSLSSQVISTQFYFYSANHINSCLFIL